MKPTFASSILIVIACGWLCRIGGCVVAHAQAPPAAVAPVIVRQTAIDYPLAGYTIQRWTVNGAQRAQEVVTNWVTNAVVVIGTPKAGGTVTNQIVALRLATNALTVLQTNGNVYAFILSPPPVTIWRAMEIVGLETTTNLADPLGWHPVGWDARAEPQRYFRTIGTNSVEKTTLTLATLTFTNQP